MVRRWIGLAVVALCLGVPTARAQPAPSEPVPGAMPSMPAPPAGTEPMAFPSGYGGPAAAPSPAGCGNAVQVPADEPTAWKSESGPGGRCGCYLDLGIISLQHERPGHLPLAVLDPGNGTDTGNPIPRRAPLLQDMHSINLDFATGVKATLGYHWDSGDAEVSGFYLPRNTSGIETQRAGKIDALFFNPPVGFEGDNGMWLQADVLRTRLRTELGSAEGMINCWNNSFGNFEAGGGVRYINEVERLTIYTGDDDLTVRDINGNPDPRRQATYLVRTQNNYVGPQIGVQFTGCICDGLNLVLGGKASVGADFLEAKIRLERGDGFVGFSNERDRTVISQLYEAGIYLDWCFCDGFHLRTGYTALWLVDFIVAQDQVDYNLQNNLGRMKDNGSIFYGGPVVEFQMLY